MKKAAAFTQGIEIEQFPADTNVGPSSSAYSGNVYVDGMPTNVIRDADILDWHRDGSGPQETTIGPSKMSMTLLKRFFKDTRDKGEEFTWDWHAADSNGRGAGSHVHLCVEDIFDDSPTAWAIAYNTVVELAPFFAPYFCHNWEQGFRDGSRSVEQWAKPQTTRLSPETVESMYLSRHSWSRPYKSVLFNPPSGGSSGGKPVTIEMRMNDAHPSVALAGLGQMQRISAAAIEAGWSPKLVDRENTLNEAYRRIYAGARRDGLLTAMQEPMDIRFEENRGIPGVKQLEFDSMFDVLKATFNAYPRTPNHWSHRVEHLIRAGRDEFGPQNNSDALWNIDAKLGEFYWQNGPVSRTLAAEKVTGDEAEAYEAAAPEPTVAAADGGDR